MPWKAKKNPVLVAIINMANYLCHISGIGASGRPVPLEIDERTWDIFQSNNIPIGIDDLSELQNQFYVEFDKTETLTSFLYKESE